MHSSKRIEVLQQLKHFLQTDTEALSSVYQKTYQTNRWFTPENQRQSIEAITTIFLDATALSEWIGPYTDAIDNSQPKTIGLIPAGNIPLVGFHDWLAIFMTGNKAVVKSSEKDPYWLPFIVEFIERTDTSLKGQTVFVERLSSFDKVIATGSNNTSRYFEAYLSKVPNIIRKNRQSVAVLSGTETDEQLLALGNDILDYFGLGCRNVSKIYLPQGFDKLRLFRVLEAFDDYILHDKYKNNFDYNYALYLLNQVPFFHNNSLVFLENNSFTSRIAAVHFEYYEHIELVEEELLAYQDTLQCIVSEDDRLHTKTVPFGFAQKPTLWDYPDNVNTLEFLLG